MADSQSLHCQNLIVGGKAAYSHKTGNQGGKWERKGYHGRHEVDKQHEYIFEWDMLLQYLLCQEKNLVHKEDEEKEAETDKEGEKKFSAYIPVNP